MHNNFIKLQKIADRITGRRELYIFNDLHNIVLPPVFLIPAPAQTDKIHHLKRHGFARSGMPHDLTAMGSIYRLSAGNHISFGHWSRIRI